MGDANKSLEIHNERRKGALLDFTRTGLEQYAMGGLHAKRLTQAADEAQQQGHHWTKLVDEDALWRLGDFSHSPVVPGKLRAALRTALDEFKLDWISGNNFWIWNQWRGTNPWNPAAWIHTQPEAIQDGEIPYRDVNEFLQQRMEDYVGNIG